MTTSIAEVVLRLDAMGRENEVLHGENAALRAVVARGENDALRAVVTRIQDLHRISTLINDWCTDVTALVAVPHPHRHRQGHIVNDLTTALNEVVALRAVVSRIQGLHHIHDLTVCFECAQPWPCPTVTAINKVTS